MNIYFSYQPCMCNSLKCWFKHPLPYLPFRKPLVCFIDIKLECHLLLLHSYCCCLPDPPFSILGLIILLEVWSFLQTTFKLVASCKHLWMWSNVNAIGKLSNFKCKLAIRGESCKTGEERRARVCWLLCLLHLSSELGGFHHINSSRLAECYVELILIMIIFSLKLKSICVL